MLDSVETSSIVPGASRAPEAARALMAVRGLAGLRSLPLSVSVLAHVGLAFVAAQHVTPRAVVVREPVGQEVAAPDLALEPGPVAAAPEPASAVTANAQSLPAPAALPRVVTRVASAPEKEAVASSASEAEPSPVLAAAPSATAPRFALTVAANRAPSGSLTGAASTQVGAPGSTVEAPISEHAADAPAKLVAGAPPAYTAAAQAAGIEADVPLEIVVDRAGAVQGARALTHIGYGLDEAALTAVRSYRFVAARRAGSAVAVRMRWLMRFQLR